MEIEEKEQEIKAENIPKAKISMTIATFCAVFIFVGSTMFFVLKEYFKVTGELTQVTSRISQIEADHVELNAFVDNGYIRKTLNGEFKFAIDYEGLSCLQISEKMKDLNATFKSKNCDQ